jgi:helicase
MENKIERLEDLKSRIPKEIYGYLDSLGIKSLLPPQVGAVSSGLFDGKDLLVSAPTASGKTLIAEMAIMRALLQGKKAIYIAPMRALLAEKFDEFRLNHKEAKVALSIGDFNEFDKRLERYDVIFVSTEKLDSLLRHAETYITNVGCIVYDEVHLLMDSGRGPVLEYLISLNKKVYPNAQVIGLSATMSNCSELGRWMGCSVVESGFRPVKLDKMIYLNGELFDGKKIEINNVDDPILNIALYLLKQGKQALVFCQNRKATVATAKLLSGVVAANLDASAKAELKAVSSDVLGVLERPTSQCEELGEVVKNGVAFHHAGLMNKQRKLVEDAFRSGKLKFIAATPTLAMGVNLPANTVIISSVYRYGDFGMESLPAFEIEQMVGRAGRPKYDSEGTAIILARSERERELIEGKYLSGDIEPIMSRFNNEIPVRIYTLALFCFRGNSSVKQVIDFFDGLLAPEQGKDLTAKVEDAVEFLISNGFLEKSGDSVSPTDMGRLVNSLYLDPFTAILFLRFIEKLKKGAAFSSSSALHLLFCSDEFGFIRVSQSEFRKYEDESYELELLADQNLVEYERFIAAIKMMHVMSDWIDEAPERDIEERYGMSAGELYNSLENIRWLLHGLKELSKARGLRENNITKLEKRVENGIKEELVGLVSVPRIGRIRARKLFSSGLKTTADLRKADVQRLSSILGAKIGRDTYWYFHSKNEEQRKLDVTLQE